MSRHGTKTRRASGGKRAGDKRRAERAAQLARPDGYRDDLIAGYEAQVGPLPRTSAEGFPWLARLLAWACDSAIRDPGIPPERAREQLARLGPALVRALDPAKVTEQLSELEEAHAKAHEARVPRAEGIGEVVS